LDELPLFKGTSINTSCSNFPSTNAKYFFLIKEIKSAHSIDELKYIHTKYLDIIQNSFTKNIPIFHINAVASELLYSIIQRNIQMAIDHLGSPPARFVWLAVGSQGRKEQLYLSDQDSLLIYEDVAADKQRDVKYYFVQLAKMVIGNLEKLGYKLCPNDHMASSVKWCRSLTEFALVYQDWMVSPNKKDNDFSSIFLDFEFVFGEVKIKDALESHIYQKIKSIKKSRRSRNIKKRNDWWSTKYG
jgi:CBS domain-containing protein